MRRRISYIFIITLVLGGCLGCSSGGISVRQEQTEIKSWISLALEIELFVDQLLRQRLNDEFANGHIQYLKGLRDDIRSNEKKHTVEPSSEAMTAANDQIRQLSEVIDLLPTALHNDSLLNNYKSRLERVASELEITLARL
jgi:hypothetical protein